MIKRLKTSGFAAGWTFPNGFVLALFLVTSMPAVRAQGHCGDLSGAEAAIRGAGINVDFGAVHALYDLNGGLCAWDQASAAAMVSYAGAVSDHGLDPTSFMPRRSVRKAGRPASAISC